MSIASRFLWPCFAFLLMFSGFAVADVEFAGVTRFIFNAENKQKAVTVVNTGRETILVQVVLEWGNEGDSLRDLPMALSNSVFKVAAGERQTFDVLYQGVGLPQDRESYFLLSITDIPQRPEQANILQVALRHRLKLLFRPALSMSIEEAIAQLYWTDSSTLQAHNDSPYYLTLTDVRFHDRQGRDCAEEVEHTMIAPFSTVNVQAREGAGPVSVIHYKIINDDGRAIAQAFSIAT